jgi:molecular chaperone DnaK (HSP70)
MAEDGSVALVPLELTSPTNCFSLPSYVTVGVASASGEWQVGRQALSRAKAGHPYTIQDLTVLLGKKVNALSPLDVARWAFKVQAGVAGKALVECPSSGGGSPDLAYPEQVAAMLLSTIKQRAEAFTGKRVTNAVVSVPAAFNRTQRQALRDACSIAGLQVDRFIVSSSASVVANADAVSNNRSDPGKTVAVVDCGGGSLNVTLARVRVNRREDEFHDPPASIEARIVATTGDLDTGVEALAERLYDHFASEARAVNASSASPAFSRRLQRASKLALKILSTSQQASIDLPPWQPRRGARTSTHAGGAVAGFTSTISRADFEDLCGTEVWSRLSNHIEQVLELAKVKREDVDAVLVTGGAMHVPKFREVLGDCFAQQRHRVVDLPEHTTAIGAALVATRSDDCLVVHEPTPLALGIRSSSGDTLVVVPLGTPVPTRQARLYYASCQNEITFDILEGVLDPNQGANRSTRSSAEHCLGRALIDGSRASSPLILKLEIAFEVDAANRLVLVVSDDANNRTIRLDVAGDETCLSAEAVALAKPRLHEVLRNAAASDGLKTPPPPSASSLANAPLEDDCPIDTLRTCVAALKPMVQTNQVGVCISPGDLFTLRSRVEHAAAWLDQIDPRQDTSDSDERAAQEYLRQLRLLHLSSTAGSAFTQLRQELNQLN